MTTLTLHDPRHLEGDPHEVAEIAGNQMVSVIEHLQEVLDNFGWAARGAWMTAEEHLTGDMPHSEEFWKTPQGQLIRKTEAELLEQLGRAKTLTIAASFNPRAPIGKHD